MTLQKQLLSITLGSGFQDQINDVDDGIKLIAKHLSNKKVLLVLDDVDDEEQLQKLAINRITFCSGSRVIVTTRNKSIMKSNKTLEYEVKPLENAQSLELFSQHAFRRNPPPYEFVNLSRQIISTTGGLPLALEVIGSLLCHQNKASWNDVLDNLRKIPHKKVQDKLKISYTALNHEEQQIFLDIACLFVDKDKTNAFYMWKDCGFGPDYSIQVLVCMSLIKITDDNKFWMHDQLRDLGRKIVRGDMRLTDPKKQSRLWVPEMANNIIGTKERKKAIEAICLCEPTRVYTSKEFSRLPNIRFLILKWGNFKGDFANQFSELRYMTCTMVSREFLAINFHPSNLVVLQLTFSSITEEWAGWSQFKVAKKLKVLDISYCSDMTKTPNFSNYLSLEILKLRGCKKLTEVDGSLKKLKCLIYFDVNGCKNLRELPKGIGGLQKLKYLNLCDCQKLRKLPESFARLTSLVQLDLSSTAITRLPDTIGNQKRLSILNLTFTKIDELPNSIGNLRELKSLFLSYTNIRELPFSIGNLESLLELDISYTNCMQLPKSIGDLSRLKIIKISRTPIKKLQRSIVMLKELEELHADECLDLKWEIPEDIWQLSLLRVLDLRYTPIKNIPQKIKLLPRLEKLSLGLCSKLKVLPELPTNLISLSLGSHLLQQLPNLSNLTKLEDLNCHDYDEYCGPFSLQYGQCQLSLEVLPPCVSTLSLEDLKSTTSLSFRCNLRKLTRLNIFQCCWKEVQLDGLEQLVEFDVCSSDFVDGFTGLSSLKRLKLLRLKYCGNLTAIQGLGSLDSLEQLDIVCCCDIGSLDDLSDLKKLKSLTIENCPSFR
ncbi:disease resistance protein RUN1-like [Eucalyptus grandis]|uniref:disease resistance protein RUN1-like n=1 Tax=Eucalyptus grandis TaxID=71139 RepID=UPI00192E94B4|nr:disease resistance protein RUN1-like [Eucalyptus grandis]